MHIPDGGIINEDSPIESQPSFRDVYAQTKLIQESLFRDFEQKNQGEVTILRPGIVYGRNNLWNAHLGVNLKNRLWIRIGGNAQLPLTYVENCAQAIIKACISQEAIEPRKVSFLEMQRLQKSRFEQPRNHNGSGERKIMRNNCHNHETRMGIGLVVWFRDPFRGSIG